MSRGDGMLRRGVLICVAFTSERMANELVDREMLRYVAG